MSTTQLHFDPIRITENIDSYDCTNLVLIGSVYLWKVGPTAPTFRRGHGR